MINIILNKGHLSFVPFKSIQLHAPLSITNQIYDIDTFQLIFFHYYYFFVFLQTKQTTTTIIKKPLKWQKRHSM